MTKSFNRLVKKMSVDAQRRAKAKTEIMTKELLLTEIRQAKNMSQEKLAELLHTKQASISKVERRVDMYISTLRNYIEALGGKLEIYADFPEGKLEIKQFQDDDLLSKISFKAEIKKDSGDPEHNISSR